ncbi:MAG: FAD-binding oxidoreductase [Chloroflexota bacterium]
MTVLQAKTSDGTPTKLEETAVEALQTSVRGDLIRPGDEGYDAARAVYNAMIDRRPALIARCADVADVIAAVTFAQDNHLLLAIRGGGHNGAGLGTCDGGLVIDLSPMRGIRVDPVACTVRVQGGATWGDVDHATHAFGLATPSGFISTTGVGGLTLGGGLGYLTRKYGLSIDNLLEADVVLADGRFVTASAEEHPDLFWALRGGGGNFGVVTSFLFQLHPVSTVFGGPILWPLERSGEAMRFWQDYLARAPEDMNAFFAFMVVPPGPPFPEHLHGKTLCGVVICYAGPQEQAEEVVRPLREFGPPVFEQLGPMPYPVLQTAFDALFSPGLHWYWKADFVKELSDAAIAEHVKYGPQLPTPLSTMHLYPIDGAANRVGRDETAFSYREARFAEVIVGVDADPANNERMIHWAREYWEALHPHSAGGAYVNMMMEEGADRVQAAYRGNYARLAQVKAQYDPTNLFRVNQNIQPAA